MKTPGLLLILLGFCTSIQSQVPSTAVSPEDAAFNTQYAHRAVPRVTGKLLHLSAAELKSQVISYWIVTPFSGFQVSKTTSAQPDGSFQLVLDYAFPRQEIFFGVGDYFYAALYADKDLYVELDMTKLKAKQVEFNGDGVRYLGTDGPMNNYLNNYILYQRPQRQQIREKITDLSHSKAPADSVAPLYHPLYDSLKIIEDSYIAAHPSPHSWILANERLSEYYGEICMKYWRQQMSDSLWQEIKQHKAYLISNSGSGYYRYMGMYLNMLAGPAAGVGWKDVAAQPDLSAHEKALIDSIRDSEKMNQAYPYTMENMKKWFLELRPRMQQLSSLRALDKSIGLLDSIFPPAKADFMKLRLNSNTDLNEQKLALAHLLENMRTPWCQTVVKSEYQHTVDKINEVNKMLAGSTGNPQDARFGKPLIETSFGASLYDASGMKAADLLARLKQSFPNKALLIDRWATWCAPCLGEMPHSKALHDSTTDLPVVFVYLCTTSGSDESKWKSKVMELKQPGIHFLIDEKLDAEISGYFSFSGYPGHALIDKSGVYRPGAFRWMTDIPDRSALLALINR